MQIKIFRPTKSNFITQGFGLLGTAPSLIPMYNSIGLKAHDGIDFGVNCRDNQVKHGGFCESVYCNVATDLEITYIQKSDTDGFGIIACTPDKQYKFLWWHFDTINP